MAPGEESGGLFPKPGRQAADLPSSHIESDTSRKFSPSKLDTYRECPRRYRYRYVDRLRREVETVEAYLGTCVHKALQRLYEGLAHGKRLSREEALQAFDDGWDAGWSGAVVIKHKEYAPENYRAVGRDCVRAYYEAQAPFDRDKTVALERRLGFPLESGGESYRIEGLVDRLAQAPDGAFEIHDYKTTGSLPGQEELGRDWQLAVYDIAVRHNWPEERAVRLVWHFLRFGKTMTLSRSPQEREALKAEVAALIGTIKRDHGFLPRRSALCEWCEYRDICPLWAHAEQVKALTSSELRRDEGVKLADQYGLLEAGKRELREKLRELEGQQKALEEALVAFADRHGFAAVAGLDGEVTITDKEEYRFPTRTHAPEVYEEIEAELKETPLWKDVSHLDAHRLMEGYKRKEWDAAAMEAITALLGRHSRHIELVRRKILRFHRKKEAEAE